MTTHASPAEPTPTRALPSTARRLLWFDCAAAASSGLLVAGLRHWLAALHHLPASLLGFFGGVSLLYAAYSGTLAVSSSRGLPLRRRWIDLLIAGNLAWSLVCLGTAVTLWPTASALGRAHLLLEAVFVAALAGLEYKLVRPAAT